MALRLFINDGRFLIFFFIISVMIVLNNGINDCISSFVIFILLIGYFIGVLFCEWFAFSFIFSAYMVEVFIFDIIHGCWLLRSAHNFF